MAQNFFMSICSDKKEHLTSWHQLTGYAFTKRIPIEGNLKVLDTLGIKYVVHKSHEEDGFSATEITSGARLGRGKTIESAAKDADSKIKEAGYDFTFARISRIIQGNMGLRVEPKDLFSYGILK